MSALDKICDCFPGWEVHHTGGGIVVLRKDFMDTENRPVMVSVSNDLALIMREKAGSDKFIDHSTFLGNQDFYWGEAEHLEVPVAEVDPDTNEVRLLRAAEIFDSETSLVITNAVKKLGKLVWGY